MLSLPFARKPLLSALQAVALATVPLAPLPVFAAETATSAAATREFSIAAGPLSRVLGEFASAAGVALSFDAATLGARQSPGLKGRFGVESGFAELLRGSGLQAVKSGDGSYVLQPLPGAPVTLATMKISASGIESAYGPVDGYVAQRSASGTKTDTPIIETPQSISVVTADEISAFKAQNLTEALGYTAGVARGEGADRTTDGLVIRGFAADTYYGSLYRDGSKFLINAYNGQQELYGLERVEVLKGAASVLYGSAAPGGVVNTVSKRPSTVALRELNAEVGSFERKQVSGDFTDAIDSAGEWSYRLTFLERDSDTFIDYVPDDRTFVAPALKWQPNDATSLTILAEYQHDLTTYVYALPVQGTIEPNAYGRIDRDRFVGEPDYDKYENTRHSAGYLFEHAFNDSVKLRHSARYLHAENDMPSVWIDSLADDQRTTAFRGAQDREDSSYAVMSDTSLQFRFTSGAVVHTLLAGVDYADQDHESVRFNRDALPIDLYDPVYGQPISPPNSDYSWQVKSERYGVYLQDQMKIADKWVVLLGGRQDWVRLNEAEDSLDEERNWTVDSEKNDAFSGRAGVVYLADNGLAPFVSYSESFEPVTGESRNHNRFDPTVGEQYETGVRYKPQDRDILLSAAVYQITQKNVAVTDPANEGSESFSIQHGEVRSRGFEFEAKVALDRNTNVIAAYAYTDARTTRSSALTPEEEGKRTGGVPFNQLSLWGDYGFGEFGLAELRLGAGARYVGETLGTWVQGEVPDFTLLDVMASYTTGPWKFSLSATNVTDKTYVASCTYGCFYGEPRRVFGAVNYRF